LFFNSISFGFFDCNTAFIVHEKFHHINVSPLDSKKDRRLILKIGAIQVEKGKVILLRLRNEKIMKRRRLVSAFLEKMF
jgi:hypothetical protein